MKFRFHIVALWLLFMLFVALLAELGCATGIIPLDVLDNLAHNSASWWRQPSWLHAANFLLLAFVFLWSAILLLSPGVSASMSAVGGFSAVLLSSHFSPLYMIVPFFPPGGVLLAAALLRWLLYRSGCDPDPRGAIRGLIPAGRSDKILWSLICLLVIYIFLNQFKEAGLVVAQRTDFGTFYDAAVAVAGRTDPYGASEGAYFYPPTFAFFFRLFTWLPKAGASLLWLTCKLALAISSLGAVYGLIHGQRMSESVRRWLIIGITLVAARFILADLQYGNVNIVVIWLSLMAIVLDFRGKSLLAGLALAAAISIKVVPAVFLIYFIVSGRFRAVLWTAIWLLALNLLPFAVSPHFFREPWASYLAAGVHDKLGSRLAQPDNQSLWGALNRALELSFSQARRIWIACSAAFTAVAAWVAFRSRRKEFVYQVGAAALFFLLGLLVSPGSWVVHYAAVLLPMSYLLRAAIVGRSHAYLYWIVFIVANIAFTVSGWSRLSVRMSIEQSWFVAANCLLFFTLVLLISIPQHSRDVNNTHFGGTFFK